MIGNKCYELRMDRKIDYYLLRSASKETTEATLLVWRLKEIIVILSLNFHNRKQKLGVSISSNSGILLNRVTSWDPLTHQIEG